MRTQGDIEPAGEQLQQARQAAQQGQLQLVVVRQVHQDRPQARLRAEWHMQERCTDRPPGQGLAGRMGAQGQQQHSQAAGSTCNGSLNPGDTLCTQWGATRSQHRGMTSNPGQRNRGMQGVGGRWRACSRVLGILWCAMAAMRPSWDMATATSLLLVRCLKKICTMRPRSSARSGLSLFWHHGHHHTYLASPTSFHTSMVLRTHSAVSSLVYDTG